MLLSAFPKILIISHNAFSTTKNNGKSLNSLFQDWPSDRIAQLFFYPEKPDFSVCKNFFNLTDRDIIKSYFCRNKTGESSFAVLDKKDSQVRRLYSSGIYKVVAAFRNDLLLLFRDLIWHFGKWKSKQLIDWLDSFNPEIVLFVGGESRFSYDIALWVAEHRNIPFYLYCTDDYTSAKLTINPFFWIKYIGTNERINRAIKISKKVFVIGEDMADEYSGKFGGNFTVIMNSINAIQSPAKVDFTKDILNFVYIGNIGLERWRSLVDIGRCLSELILCGTKCALSVYCHEPPSDKILKALTLPPHMRYCGSLDAEGVQAALKNADILVHVESFKAKYRHITRLSVSTKIPEYLANSKCILAYGPEDVASMRYLIKYNTAVVAFNNVELREKIRMVVESSEIRAEVGRRAYNLALEKHFRINMIDYL